MVEQFNSVCDELELQPISTTVDHGTQFQIPEHYRELDVETYIRARIMDDLDGAATARVEQELELYRARNLYPVLQTLIYIVDTMRKNGIVWGVGRGSSVASYCLYLIGVHSIDSIKYDLDIQEFFKQR
jgi:DNA polymerase III alpha subunit